MVISVIGVLAYLSGLWVFMVIVDAAFSITTPKVDHVYKNVGAALMVFTAIGWVWFALAFIATGLGVIITGV